jgi:lipoprotein NlpD
MNKRCAVLVCAWLAISLAACSSAPPAPVVERSNRPEPEAQPVDGLYQVRKGDNLAAIAFRYGLDYRDIAAWNGISAPWTIYPDQVLRLSPPLNTSTRTATHTSPAPAPKSETRKPAVAATKPSQPANTAQTAPPPATSAPQSSPAAPTVSPGSTEPEGWRWPTQGRLLRTFSEGDPSRNGIDIAAAEGQDVVASAAGQVVYSGNGLIGYGELVIIRHSEQTLSAYAHNSRRLVAEGASVTAGQKIAEVGRNDRNETLLHFEIRRNGKPVNPLNYLPKQ